MRPAFAVVFRRSKVGVEVLLGRKRDSRGALTTPGGGAAWKIVEIDGSISRILELPIETCQRELLEEAGIDAEVAATIAPSTQNGYFLVEVSPEVTPSSEPERGPNGRPVWGPGKFFPANKLPEHLAKWQKDALKEVLREIMV